MPFRRIIRFSAGAILPVPLFILLFYGSYLFKSYHGYDFETQEYIIGSTHLANSRSHAQTDLSIFLLYGYFIMGLPSLIYSFLLERARAKNPFNINHYLIFGAIAGFACSFIFLFTSATVCGNWLQILHAITASIIVGSIIALLLLSVKVTQPTKP